MDNRKVACPLFRQALDQGNLSCVIHSIAPMHTLNPSCHFAKIGPDTT